MRVGQKVLCVKKGAWTDKIGEICSGPKHGDIVTVACVKHHRCETGLLLEEWPDEMIGYNIVWFRIVEEIGNTYIEEFIHQDLYKELRDAVEDLRKRFRHGDYK